MNSWDEGYFTQSGYVYGYYRDISPTFQRFCLLLHGYLVPESDQNSVHCELGYGQGVSINIHAAATPGKYIGTDFNPEHATHANQMLRASGCDARFYDDSFAQMLERDGMPQFDSISLHGIWSWISHENQRHIVEFAKRFLKPGSVFYNSYNCFPGWAPNGPLRELLAMYDQRFHGGENAHRRVENALKFAEDVLNAEPDYLKMVPGLSEVLKNMKKHDHDYLAHEYLNRDWILMYFADVAAMLEEAKLHFACTTEPGEFLEALNFSTKALEFLKTLDDPVMREQVKDYFIVRQFRKDIYTKGAQRISGEERLQRLLDVRLTLMNTEPLPLKIKLSRSTLTMPEAAVRTIHEYLAGENYRPKSLRGLFERYPAMAANDTIQRIIVFIQCGLVMPCQSEAAAQSVRKRCDALNSYLCERAMWSGDIITLASPALGGGLNVGRFDQIFLHLMKKGHNDVKRLSAAAWQTLSRQGLRMIVNQRQLREEEHVAHFQKMAREFLDKRVPILRALQIMQ